MNQFFLLSVDSWNL